MKTTTRQDEAAHLRTLDYDTLATASFQLSFLLVHEQNYFERERLRQEIAAIDAEIIRRRSKRRS